MIHFLFYLTREIIIKSSNIKIYGIFYITGYEIKTNCCFYKYVMNDNKNNLLPTKLINILA